MEGRRRAANFMQPNCAVFRDLAELSERLPIPADLGSDGALLGRALRSNK